MGKDPYRDGGAKGTINGVPVVRRDDGAILDSVSGEVMGALVDGLRGGFLPNEKGKRDLRFARLINQPFEGVSVPPGGKEMADRERMRAEDEMAARLSANQNPVITNPEDPRTGTVPDRQQMEDRLAKRLSVAQNYESTKPSSSSARAVKFSSARAQVLSDNEYEYAIDPSSGVIKFLKVPAGKEHLVGKYLTSANQKNAAAYKAIMDMYRTKYPPSTDIEGEIVEEEDSPASPAPKPLANARPSTKPGSPPDRRTLLTTDYNSI
jgi:hypothetical protein